MEFLVRIELVAPPGMNAEELADLRQRESQRASELAADGNIVRLWRSASKWGNWGLWTCGSREILVQLLDSLPLRPFMTIDIHDLGQHPSDPLLHAAQEEDPLHG
jgi:muconolactone D-isomerase